jgi:hypothetical protein
VNWKSILALTLLAAPVAYCSAKEAENSAAYAISCVEHGGELNWRRVCVLP